MMSVKGTRTTAQPRRSLPGSVTLRNGPHHKVPKIQSYKKENAPKNPIFFFIRDRRREKMTGDDKSGDYYQHPYHHQQQQQPPPPYGAVDGGPAGYYPHQYQQQPAMGFPQPVAPPGVIPAPGHPSARPTYYVPGYHAVAGYATIVEGMPLIEPRLPCCGMGMGWFLFIIGFFLGTIPWYVAAFILLCARVDYREKPGYIACTIGAVIVTFLPIVLTLG